MAIERPMRRGKAWVERKSSPVRFRALGKDRMDRGTGHFTVSRTGQRDEGDREGGRGRGVGEGGGGGENH